MKAALVSIAALASVASAQIHRDRHGNAHHRLHEKRDVVVTHVDYVTATAPNAVVYVDGNGKPISTDYNGGAAPEATSSPPAAPEYKPSSSSKKHVVHHPSPSHSSSPKAYTLPAYSVSSSTSTPAESPTPYSSAPAASPSSPSSGSGSSGLGLSYSPYTTGPCKDAAAVASDFEKISGYGMVRIYGTDCDQVSNVIAAAKPKGMKVFAGVYDINNVAAETQIIIDAAKDDWSIIDTVSVGNELVNAGKASVDQVVAAINTARGMLKGAGYTGDVVTVDTFVAMIANPALCEASDYAAANAHAFFDGGVTADEAGKFVADQAQRVKFTCGNKKTVITETGWPYSGESNKAAVPSRSNQAAAISSIKSAMSDKDVILFTAFDDTWKTDFVGSFGCEKFWGLIQ